MILGIQIRPGELPAYRDLSAKWGLEHTKTEEYELINDLSFEDGQLRLPQWKATQQYVLSSRYQHQGRRRETFSKFQ